MSFLQDPEEIYRRSFDIIRSETDLSSLPDGISEVAIRLVHSCGIPEIVSGLRWSDTLVEAVSGALQAEAPVICDTRMTSSGISRLPASSQVLCMIELPNVAAEAQRLDTTRSAAQVEFWKPFLPGSIVAIGNAPTALFRLLEMIAEDPGRKPAAILGFPVGFVGAVESKHRLDQDNHGVPYLTLMGRLGGSAMAAAAVNAFARLTGE